jgi:GT2 family glycosyltransferase
MLMDVNPLVSIITLNWNGTVVTCDLLRSIAAQNTYSNIEVIVVDNASREDPGEACLAVYPDARIVRTGSNLGFAGGNNAGIRAARGDYFFIVNNDTEFTPFLLEHLLAVFKEHPNAGMASPKFHYFFDKGRIEYAGYEDINILTGRNGMIGHGEVDGGQYDKLRQTPYVHGGAMMLPRSVVEAAGFMPEQFFLYYEELDWSAHIRKKGFELYYQPAALIYHKESMTTGKASPLKTFYLTRNRILFMRRNVSRVAFVVFAAYFVCLTVPKNTLGFLVKGQRDHLRSFWKGIFWQFNSAITYA